MPVHQGFSYGSRTIREEAIPRWSAIASFARGMAQSMEFKRQRMPEPSHGQAALMRKWSFDDFHKAVGSITRNFASFLEALCQDIKASPMDLEKNKGTCRIPLSDLWCQQGPEEEVWVSSECDGTPDLTGAATSKCFPN